MYFSSVEGAADILFTVGFRLTAKGDFLELTNNDTHLHNIDVAIARLQKELADLFFKLSKIYSS